MKLYQSIGPNPRVVLMFLEETFDISIEDGDVTIERFDTYNSMATYVKDCLTK